MALGYAPYILSDINTALRQNKTNWKIDMLGFTQMLYTGMGAAPIRVTAPDTGGKHEHRYWYRQRPTKNLTETSYACDNVNTSARKEVTVTTPKTRFMGWHLPDELITNYHGIGTGGANMGGKVVSPELMDIVFSSANALLSGVNTDLQSLVTWGNNATVTSGSKSAAQTINLPTASTTMVLGNGVAKILTDYKSNGLSGRPNIVGLGKMFSYSQYAALSSNSNQSGFDNRLATGSYDFWADQDWETSFAADQIGLFEPGSIQVVEYLETDFRKGPLGTSYFFQVNLPTQDINGNYVPVLFDCQLKEIDCPTTLTDAYSGSTATYNRGVALFMWKNFGLFQTPIDSFSSPYQDRLEGVNGALRYAITNS